MSTVGLNHRYMVRNFAIPAAGAFAPTDIAGLRAWYDPSDAASITASGGLVSQINDKSGNAFHMTQATGSKQPTTGSRTINGLNVLDFTDDTLYATTPATIMGSPAAATALYVCVRDADPPPNNATSGAVLGIWGTGAGGQDHEPYLDGNVYHGFGSTTRQSTGNPTPSFTTARQVTIITSASEWTYKIDGTNHYTTASNTVGWMSSGSAIGGNIGESVTGYWFDGGIAEILLYDTALSGSNLTNAQNYLKTKWGTA